jgi:hypothetical protein
MQCLAHICIIIFPVSSDINMPARSISEALWGRFDTAPLSRSGNFCFFHTGERWGRQKTEYSRQFNTFLPVFTRSCSRFSNTLQHSCPSLSSFHPPIQSFPRWHKSTLTFDPVSQSSSVSFRVKSTLQVNGSGLRYIIFVPLAIQFHRYSPHSIVSCKTFGEVTTYHTFTRRGNRGLLILSLLPADHP